jgi:hypothetical protein
MDAVMSLQETLRAALLSKPSVLQTLLNQLQVCCTLLLQLLTGSSCLLVGSCRNDVTGGSMSRRCTLATIAAARTLQAVQASVIIAVTLLC